MPTRLSETTPRADLPDSSFKYTPLQHVRTCFASFAQGLFYAAPAGSYHWDPDLELTEIVITDENPINVDVVGKRPAITFTRGPIQFYSLGLDDMMSYDFETGSKQKSVLVPGTMTVNFCSRNDLESERLAWIFSEHLWLLREKMMQEGFFEIGRQPMMGSPSPAGSIVQGDSAREWYVTAVAFPFQFYRTSRVTPLNQQIAQNVNVLMRSSAVGPLSTNPYRSTTSGADLSVNIHVCPADPFAPAASDVYGGTPNPGETASKQLPLYTHPLDPSKRVVVRNVTPHRPGLRTPGLSGQVLPISNNCVEESTPVTDTNTVKV